MTNDEGGVAQSQHLVVLASLLFATVFARLLSYWEGILGDKPVYGPQVAWSIAAGFLAVVNWCVLWYKRLTLLAGAVSASLYFASIFALYLGTAHLVALPGDGPLSAAGTFHANRPLTFSIFTGLFVKYLIDAWMEEPQALARMSPQRRSLVLIRVGGAGLLFVTIFVENPVWHWIAAIAGTALLGGFFAIDYSLLLKRGARQ